MLSGSVVGLAGRRPLLVGGALAMGVCMAAAGACLHWEWYVAAFLLMIAFTAAYGLTAGSVTWLYLAETSVDQAAGLVMFCFCSADAG